LKQAREEERRRVAEARADEGRRKAREAGKTAFSRQRQELEESIAVEEAASLSARVEAREIKTQDGGWSRGRQHLEEELRRDRKWANAEGMAAGLRAGANGPNGLGSPGGSQRVDGFQGEKDLFTEKRPTVPSLDLNRPLALSPGY